MYTTRSANPQPSHTPHTSELAARKFLEPLLQPAPDPGAQQRPRSALDGVLVVGLLWVVDLPAAGREDVLVALIPVPLHHLGPTTPLQGVKGLNWVAS